MHPVMLEWAYAREVMRCLGFLPDELFFAVNAVAQGVILDGKTIKVDKPVISLILRSQDKSFTWAIGTADLAPDQIKKAYEELCESWNAGGEWNVEDFRASNSFKQKLSLIDALQSKGFKLNPKRDQQST